MKYQSMIRLAAAVLAVLLAAALTGCSSSYADITLSYCGETVRVHFSADGCDTEALTAGCQALAEEYQVLLQTGTGEQTAAWSALAASVSAGTEGAVSPTALSPMANGLLAEALTEYLRANGVAYGLIELGGSSCVFGIRPDGNPWTVKVTDPLEEGDMIGYLMVDEGYVASRTDRDGIIDHRTGKPVDNGVYSVTVVSRSPREAEIIAEAIFVLGYDEAMEFYRDGGYIFEALVYSRHGIFQTDHIGRSYWQKDTTPATRPADE